MLYYGRSCQIWESMCIRLACSFSVSQRQSPQQSAVIFLFRTCYNFSSPWPFSLPFFCQNLDVLKINHTNFLDLVFKFTNFDQMVKHTRLLRDASTGSLCCRASSGSAGCCCCCPGVPAISDPLALKMFQKVLMCKSARPTPVIFFILHKYW